MTGMFKAFLYIFAILGLLVSPVNELAAQDACAKMEKSMSMAMMDSHDHAAIAMPCCNEDISKSSDAACFQNCIAMCGISAISDLDLKLDVPVLHVEPVLFALPSANSTANKPSLFGRPPRFNA